MANIPMDSPWIPHGFPENLPTKRLDVLSEVRLYLHRINSYTIFSEAVGWVYDSDVADEHYIIITPYNVMREDSVNMYQMGIIIIIYIISY